MRIERGLDFIDACAAEADTGRAIAAFLDAIAAFGFDACAAGAWSGVGATRVYRFYFNTWPEEWNAIYERGRLFENDPVTLEARRRMTPFLLSEEEQAMRRTPGAGAVIDACYAFGWAEVFAVPLHGPNGYQGLVSLAAFRPVAPDARERAVLAAMAHAVHERCHATIGFGQRSRPAPALTARQIEVMRWVAVGKTDAEIGLLLGLAPATAHYHVEKIKRLLGVSSRAEASALLVLEGIV